MLKEKEKLVYDYIRKFIDTNSYPPSIRDILKDLNFKSTATVHSYVERLVEKGYIIKHDQKTRAIKIVKEKLPIEERIKASGPELDEIKYLKVPLIGDVAAGAPILAEENIEDILAIPQNFVRTKKGQETYMLRVKGESMIEAGIYDKDFIIVARDNTAKNGDIVVALIDDEATVKTFYKEKNYIRLQPENKTMEPIIVEDVKILGKVVGLFRKM